MKTGQSWCLQTTFIHSMQDLCYLFYSVWFRFTLVDVVGLYVKLMQMVTLGSTFWTMEWISQRLLMDNFLHDTQAMLNSFFLFMFPEKEKLYHFFFFLWAYVLYVTVYGWDSWKYGSTKQKVSINVNYILRPAQLLMSCHMTLYLQH